MNEQTERIQIKAGVETGEEQFQIVAESDTSVPVTYSNYVSMSLTANDVSLQFGAVVPPFTIKEGNQVVASTVARIVLAPAVAVSLLELLQRQLGSGVAQIAQQVQNGEDSSNAT